MIHKKVSMAIVEEDLILEEKWLTCYTDVMHVQRFLNPLQITLRVHIEWESQSVLGPALKGQLDLLRSKGFTPTHAKFENMSMDVGGGGGFIPKVNAKIRTVKERYRNIKGGFEVELTTHDG
jgi:hypothetical protein